MKADDVLPIKTLCSEYARGKITFQQFEQGVDRLVDKRAKIDQSDAARLSQRG